MNLSIKQVELLLLESALERAKEFEHRCRRRHRATWEELQAAEHATIRQANLVEERRREILRGDK